MQIRVLLPGSGTQGMSGWTYALISVLSRAYHYITPMRLSRWTRRFLSREQCNCHCHLSSFRMEFSSYTYSRTGETTIGKPRVLFFGKPEDDGTEITRNSKSFDIDVRGFMTVPSGQMGWCQVHRN